MSISQIAEGFYNNATDKEQDLFEERIAICRTCKLMKMEGIFGEICNSRLYLNPITDETSKVKMDGFKRGCGCVLKAKTRVKGSRCPVGKW
jgi:hypothetical protein